MVFVTEFLMQLLALLLDRRTFKYAMRLNTLRALSRKVVEVEGIRDFEYAYGIRPGAYRRYLLLPREQIIYGSRSWHLDHQTVVYRVFG